jgi:hypothetical protein
MKNLFKLFLLSYIGMQLFLIDMLMTDNGVIKIIASTPFLFMGIWLCVLLLFPRLEKKIIDNM